MIRIESIRNKDVKSMKFKKFIFLSLIALMGVVISCNSPEENEQREETNSTADLKKSENSELISSGVDYNFDFETNLDAGKKLYVTCIACHGENGGGNQLLHAPTLANLEDWYLKRQLVNFKENIRGYHDKDIWGKQMIPMASTLPDNEAIHNVISYIKTFDRIETHQTLNEGDAKEGETIYSMICGACHGPKAIGNESLQAPNLVGLEDWYIQSQLINFRDSLRGNHERDFYGKQMTPIMQTLKDDKSVQNMVSYLRSLQHEDGEE
jgi:cytochrome c oxidase subunit 2